MDVQPLHVPVNPVRFVTAASLFDGHDAAINIMRRVLQSQGAEVIHLGHDRSVESIVTAALQEDVQGVAISSYQGGHMEYFRYLVDRLKEVGAGHVRVFGGGGGVIVADEIAALKEYGVTIFAPEDGQRLGLAGMINTLIKDADVDLVTQPDTFHGLTHANATALARAITVLEKGADAGLRTQILHEAERHPAPVLGITGTGGSGKSSLTDELLRRLRLDYEDKLRIAILAIDPTRRRGGGALLGDRIRMNALDGADPSRIYFRSLATRSDGAHVPDHLDDVIAACRAADFDLIIVETPGIGQGDSAIVGLCDLSLYVMTPEYGAASQLEKISMLDFADVVAINKFERFGAEDARRDVSRQLVRNRQAFGVSWEQMPVFGTSAARFNDDGVTALYQELRTQLVGKGLAPSPELLPAVSVTASSGLTSVIPTSRARYLAEISTTVHDYHRATEVEVDRARLAQHLRTALGVAPSEELKAALESVELHPTTSHALKEWPGIVAEYSGKELVYLVRGKEIHTQLRRTTLSGNEVNRVSVPKSKEDAEIIRFVRDENLPGYFPFTAGVFPFKRQGEAPARMFAGEGDAFRTNKRFKLLSSGGESTRLSTAFDSVTLYGREPDPRPDIYGKVGTSGVSIATLDDMKVLYDGFDLTSPSTSVSMTINGPAPTILAMFLNTVIDQRVDAFTAEHGREPSAEEHGELSAWALANVRGTVQADILKEDQGQNTCIFSTEFALRCMADIQEYFIAEKIRNFYSVSISGYHIAEAGANPISQLAFTLANGFTYVEAYLARGLDIDDFAPNLSFFFSNGLDAEYSVIGRVARRIWAVAMRDKYGASSRSQMLKYHVQTSGRSLHAQEMHFNDIRTTLQALCAIYDNCNSLHTNAFDEAVTTPTESSVRRALAIQMIIDQEWGLSMNENPLQGSYVIEELTDLVEEAVLQEFDRIAERGGVLGAMETGYQRGRIQDESMLYEHRKHDGSLPLIGVNTFIDPNPSEDDGLVMELARATTAEKQSQLDRLADFHQRHRPEAPAALARLKAVAFDGGNVFGELMNAVRCCSLGEITQAFFEVGGQYRRNL